VRGEVGGSQTLVRSNHPSLPYQVNMHLHTSLGPTPPFTPYQADAYLIDATSSPAIHLSTGHAGGSRPLSVHLIVCSTAGSPAIVCAILEQPKFSFIFSSPPSDAWSVMFVA
jgi:hypothetical protein